MYHLCVQYISSRAREESALGPVVPLDTRIHTGYLMSMGIGAAYLTSTHLKINTTISMESDIISFYRLMPQVNLNRYFIEVQGY